METIKSVFIPAQSSVAELRDAITAALVTNLGWKLDESDSSVVWDNNAHNLGVNVYVNSNSIYLLPLNSSYTMATGYMFSVIWNASNTYYFDYIHSANKAAVAFGVRTSASTTPSLNVIFDGNDAIPWRSSSTFYAVHRGTAQLKMFNFSTNTNSDYTSLVLLPSMDGDVFSSVYGVFSCPAVNNNYIYYIGGSYYRIFMGYSQAWLAFKVG